ncbi:glycosyltransferase [Cohnella soli]|uniref:Glycosyltransferase n=1 Tax=Cohnella soli TaxID=425005 RepID=A0ABW0HTI1_9BACL
MSGNGKAESDLSLCMIVKDEESFLDGCLRSVSGIASEIIVADTGSSDRSRDIARARGATLVSVPWRNDFAQARNVALALATCRWILVLDADEELVCDNMSSIAALLEEADRRGVIGLNLTIVSGVGSGEEHVTDSVCRLFRNDRRIRFSGILHEEVATSILKLKPDGIVGVGRGVHVRHYGYLDRVIAAKGKSERNMRLAERASREQPDNPFWSYALGTEYYQRGEYAEALRHFAVSRHLVQPGEGYLSDLLLKIAFACRETGLVGEAIEAADEALRRFPDFPDALELRAMLAEEQGDPTQALSLLGRALAAGDRSDRYSSCSGAGTYRTLHLLGNVLERLGRLPEAEDAYERSLLVRPGYAPSLSRLDAIREGRCKRVPIVLQQNRRDNGS